MEETQSNLFDPVDQLTDASTGKRFANYLIDAIAFYALSFVLGMLLGLIAPQLFSNESSATFISYIVAILAILVYYTAFEGSTGKSIGKLITGTKVVTLNGDKITYKDAFLRSLSRLVPLEPLSIFFGTGSMWHDRWTDTMVVNAR
jgi:uncharacterized RDD family membrane protein YckC